MLSYVTDTAKGVTAINNKRLIFVAISAISAVGIATLVAPLARANPDKQVKCFKNYIRIDSNNYMGSIMQFGELKDSFGLPNWASAGDREFVCVSRDLKVLAGRRDYSGTVVGTYYAYGNKPRSYTREDIKSKWIYLSPVSQENTATTLSWFLEKDGHREFLVKSICLSRVLKGTCIERLSTENYLFIANEPDFLRSRDIYTKRMKSARYCWPVNVDGSKLQCVGG